MIKLLVKKRQKDCKTSYFAPITSTFNGQKTTAYLQVNFKRGTEIEKDSIINITNFMFASYPSKQGPRVKIVVIDYVLEESAPNEVFNDYNNEKEEYEEYNNYLGY